MNYKREYSLLIRRSNKYINYDNIQDLRIELLTHFTKSEIKSGIVTKLTMFDAAKLYSHMTDTNYYQDYEITCTLIPA